MPRLLSASARKLLTASAVAFLLLSAPTQLAAVEKKTAATDPAAVLAWLSNLWTDLAALFAADEQPPQSQPDLPAENDADNGHVVDPHGG